MSFRSESLEEMQSRCQGLEREGRLDQAQELKNEIEQKMKEEQLDRLEELRAKQESERIDLENSQLQEFQDFNAQWEKRLDNHRANANEQITALIEKQRALREEYLNELESSIPQQPKKSSELLNIIQIKNGLVKLKEYGEAHKVEKRIDILTALENKNWEIERRKKISQKLAFQDSKNENDLNALKKRLNATEDELKKKRSLEMEKLLQKFQNIKKDRQNFQTIEINKFNLQHHF